MLFVWRVFFVLGVNSTTNDGGMASNLGEWSGGGVIAYNVNAAASAFFLVVECVESWKNAIRS